MATVLLCNLSETHRLQTDPRLFAPIIPEARKYHSGILVLKSLPAPLPIGLGVARWTREKNLFE